MADTERWQEEEEQRQEGGERRHREREREAMPGRVREEDLEPHAGLRYIARLFKVLALLLVLLMIGEIVVGLMQEGASAAVFLVVEVTRLLVFAGFLWAAGDFALMQIDSNHDMRATRILLARLLARVERATEEPGSAGRQPGPPE